MSCISILQCVLGAENVFTSPKLFPRNVPIQNITGFDDSIWHMTTEPGLLLFKHTPIYTLLPLAVTGDSCVRKVKVLQRWGSQPFIHCYNDEVMDVRAYLRTGECPCYISSDYIKYSLNILAKILFGFCHDCTKLLLFINHYKCAYNLKNR